MIIFIFRYINLKVFRMNFTILRLINTHHKNYSIVNKKFIIILECGFTSLKVCIEKKNFRVLQMEREKNTLINSKEERQASRNLKSIYMFQ